MQYTKRREKLLKKLVQQGIEKIVIGNPLNIYYFTGIMINPYERFIALLLDAKANNCVIILPSLEMGIVPKENIQEIIYKDEEDPILKLHNLLIKCENLGIEMSYFSMKFGERLQLDYPKMKLSDVTKLINSCRTYKEEGEIDAISRSAKYGDEALNEVKDLIKVGCTEKDIHFALIQSFSKKPDVNLDNFVIQVLAGERAANPHGYSGDYAFKKGDPIIVDFGVHCDGYWSDFSRTFFIGEPDPKLKEIYAIVLEAQISAINLVKPGIPIKEIDLAARKIIDKAGYGECFIHRVGHGIGLNIHEYPEIHSQNDELLEEGMVFTVEPGIYIPSFGGVRIEDDIVVTKDGGKVLNNYPKDYQSMIL